MIKVAEKIKENNLESKIVAQVHDELIIACHKDELETVKSLLKDTMEQAVKLKVKMEAMDDSSKVSIRNIYREI